MSPDRPGATPRILVVRLSALGDVTMASGLIPALQQRWPGARISWLVEPAAAPLLRHHPGLDEVIVWPRAQWRTLWREGRRRELWQVVRSFVRELRRRKFDLALDAQGLLKSGLMAWLSGASRRVGLRSREGSRWLMTEVVRADAGDFDPSRADVLPLADSGSVMSSEYRALARHLGAPGPWRLSLAVGQAPREQAQARLAAAGLAGPRAGGRPLALLAAFTTRPQKHWFEERWVGLAQTLSAQGWAVGLLGGPGDREAAARIAAAAGASLVDLAGQLPLDETVAAIAQAQLLVGVDTGLTHMGAALAVPTVALFGSTRPYLQAGVPAYEVLYEPLSCSPCRRRPTCDGRFDCMRHWDVDRVMAAVARVRARAGRDEGVEVTSMDRVKESR